MQMDGRRYRNCSPISRITPILCEIMFCKLKFASFVSKNGFYEEKLKVNEPCRKWIFLYQHILVTPNTCWKNKRFCYWTFRKCIKVFQIQNIKFYVNVWYKNWSQLKFDKFNNFYKLQWLAICSPEGLRHSWSPTKTIPPGTLPRSFHLSTFLPSLYAMVKTPGIKSTH